MKKNKGFTLAEVLITLGIIGVVAALTIPTIVKNIQDYQNKVAYKKAYSQGKNAFNLAIANGENYNTLSSSTDNATSCQNWQIFSSQFKKTKECINSDTSSCWDSTGEKSSGAPSVDAYAFVDSSGVAWSRRWNCSDSGDATIFLVDTNGFKKPNKFGQDRWAFLWVLDSNNAPVRIETPSTDYVGSTDSIRCPTGPCYYKTWMLE